MKFQKHGSRSSSGNMMLIGGLSILALVFFVSFLLQADQFLSLGNRYHAAVEAAALAGARDLSKIVIDDPQFGFISLSDQPAGAVTVTDKGEALPVRGINTVLAGIRLNAIIAKELGNDQMASLAREDNDAAQSTIKNLGEVWQDAVLPPDKSRGLSRDANGKVVSVYKTVQTIFAKYLDASADKSIIVSLELGNIEGGALTVTPAPAPAALARLSESNTDTIGRFYKSGVDLAVDDLHFVFMPVSRAVTLCPNDAFKACRGGVIGSILKVQVQKPGDMSFQNTSACSVAPAYSAPVNYSALIVRLVEGAPDSNASLAKLIDTRSGDHAQISPATALGGDYPLVAMSSIHEGESSLSVSNMTARALYDWIRSTNKVIDVEKLLAAIRRPFVLPTDNVPMPAHYFYYYADQDGALTRLVSDRCVFPQDFLAENQSVGMHAMQNGAQSVGMKVQDQVRKIGRLHGGRHGGLPLSLTTIKRAYQNNRSANSEDASVVPDPISAYNLATKSLQAVPDDLAIAVLIEMTTTNFAPKTYFDARALHYPPR